MGEAEHVDPVQQDEEEAEESGCKDCGGEQRIRDAGQVDGGLGWVAGEQVLGAEGEGVGGGEAEDEVVELEMEMGLLDPMWFKGGGRRGAYDEGCGGRV